MKIVTVIGARPQFIKAAPLSRALSTCYGVQEVIVHTGQHYDSNMSQVFFDELGIPAPAVHLEVGSLNHGAQTGRILERVESVLQEERPDLMVVFGDTNSTLAGALAAAKLHIPVAHVEAGLRSRNRRMPEEVNRVLTDHISTLLFAPTQTAEDNLRLEGVIGTHVHMVGDVMYDAVRQFGELALKQSTILAQAKLTSDGYVLATIHRAENTDDLAVLRNIVGGLERVAADIPVVWPVHPRTRERLRSADIGPKAIQMIDPVGYLDMLMLEREARLVVTDSGGVQKEAFFHRTPCVTLRAETEWVELVRLGWNRLVAPDSDAQIVGAIRSALESTRPPETDATNGLYGGGAAARQIARIITEYGSSSR